MLAVAYGPPAAPVTAIGRPWHALRRDGDTPFGADLYSIQPRCDAAALKNRISVLADVVGLRNNACFLDEGRIRARFQQLETRCWMVLNDVFFL